MKRKRSHTLTAVLSVAALSLASCSTDTGVNDTAPSDPDAVQVIATTTQLGSIVEQITQCAGGQTTVLMSAADDPHQFEASSEQIANMIQADVVITNGLGLEASMRRSLENAAEDGANIVEIAPELDPLPLGDDHGDHTHESETGDEHDHEHGDFDAHVWLDVNRMADGAQLIGQQIGQTTDDSAYEQCGIEVAENLRDVDEQIQDMFHPLGEVQLVTDHDAFAYFAQRYGLKVSGVVIPGGSTDGEPSSQNLAALSQLVQDQGADALVTSIANPNRMIAALADETDNMIPVVELYESGIGAPGSDAETYQQAMLYNAKALVEALN